MRGIIYKYTNIYNNKVYIGQTINEPKRRESWNNLNIPYAGEYINNARSKYGIDAFKYEILSEIIGEDKTLIKNQLDDLESYYICLYQAKNDKYGYNLTDGGSKGKGQIVSDLTRKKMSKAQKGLKKKMSDKGRENISKAHKGPRPWTYKKVAQYDINTNELIKVWDSLTDVINHFNDKSCGNLIAAIKQKYRHKSYRGYIWKYYEN